MKCAAVLIVLVGVCCLLFAQIVVAFNSQFGSKTPYDIDTPIDWRQIINEQANLANTCQLAQLRLVTRHGTRSPDSKNIEAVKKALQKLADINVQHSGTQQQIELRNLMLSWVSQLPDGKRLLERGRLEQQFLARQFFQLVRLYGTFTPRFRDYIFHSTEIGRSYDSGVAFQEEWQRLLEEANLTKTSYVGNVTKNDARLYFHKNCPAFALNVEKSNTTSAQTKRVRLTVEGENLVTKINIERLGLPSVVLEWNNIFALYQMAAFEMAALNESLFVGLFDESDLEFLEYADELDNYWKKAYGHPMIADISCGLRTNIFETAGQVIAGETTMAAMFEFGHLETLLPVYATLGLFDDGQQAFVADASRNFIKNRAFKMSQIGPFSANFAFLLFFCPDVEEKLKTEYKMLLLINGKPHLLPRACPNELACPFHMVREAYDHQQSSSNCDITKLCQVETWTVKKNIEKKNEDDLLLLAEQAATPAIINKQQPLVNNGCVASSSSSSALALLCSIITFAATSMVL